jgi:hypothetical protein
MAKYDHDFTPLGHFYSQTVHITAYYYKVRGKNRSNITTIIRFFRQTETSSNAFTS